MTSGEVVALGAAVALGLVHLLAGKLRLLEGIPRSRWLSMAGGVSVAYVFVHVLPELSEAQETLEQTKAVAFLEQHVYLVGLLGLTVFYGLERSTLQSRGTRRQQHGDDAASTRVLWLSIVTFAVYNGIIGYVLVHREDPGLKSLVLFALAMAVHFVVNDFGLREHHKAGYSRYGRWVLAAALVVGWALGIVTDVSDAAIAVLLSFLSGGVVLNVLKEELPERRRSRFWTFALGAAAYAALLLAV